MPQRPLPARACSEAPRPGVMTSTGLWRPQAGHSLTGNRVRSAGSIRRGITEFAAAASPSRVSSSERTPETAAAVMVTGTRHSSPQGQRLCCTRSRAWTAFTEVETGACEKGGDAAAIGSLSALCRPGTSEDFPEEDIRAPQEAPEAIRIEPDEEARRRRNDSIAHGGEGLAPRESRTRAGHSGSLVACVRRSVRRRHHGADRRSELLPARRQRHRGGIGTRDGVARGRGDVPHARDYDACAQTVRPECGHGACDGNGCL